MTGYYTVQEFADILGVNRQTVYKWIYNGEIEYIQTRRHSSVRIPATELDRLRKQRSN